MAIHSPAGPTLSAPVSSGGRRLAVSFHGLAPHTQRPCQELLALLAELGVPRASLLVVPRWQGMESILERPFFLRWLLSLAEEGHEVCLYGRTGRSAAEIREGSEILAAAGLRPQGFAAPVRQLSPEDRNLLRGLGLEYSVGVRHLYLLGEGSRIAAPEVAFNASSFLRRALSPLVGRACFAASRRQPVLRVSVHPGDLYEHRVRRALASILQQALADREPVTYGELASAVTRLTAICHTPGGANG